MYFSAEYNIEYKYYIIYINIGQEVILKKNCVFLQFQII